MNKKIIAGLMSVAAVGSFWACGSGNINEADAMTDGIVSMQFNNDADPDTTKIRKINENLIVPAKEQCKQDPACYAANQAFVDSDNDVVIVASSSDAAPVIGTSSAYVPKSSSSRATSNVKPTSSADAGSDLPVAESSSAKQQITGLGTCATTTGATEINKGTSVQFQFTANPDRKAEIAQKQMSGEVSFTWDYGTGTGTAGTTTNPKSGQATYEKSGPSGASVTVIMGDEEEPIPCDLYVNGAPITCECTSPEKSVNIEASPNVTWTAACKTDAAYMPLTYEWDGVAGEATYTKDFSGNAQDGYTPKLVVGNQDNTKTTVTTCTTVKTTKGNEYQITFSRVAGANNQFVETYSNGKKESSQKGEVTVEVKKSGSTVFIVGTWEDTNYDADMNLFCEVVNTDSGKLSLKMTSEGDEDSSFSGQSSTNGTHSMGKASGMLSGKSVIVKFEGASSAKCHLN